MYVPIGNKYNEYTATLDTVAKTLTINNLYAWDLSVSSLIRIWDTTANKAIPIPIGTTCSFAYVAGLIVWTYTFPTLPAGVANGDTLTVVVDVPKKLGIYALYGYTNGAAVGNLLVSTEGDNLITTEGDNLVWT